MEHYINTFQAAELCEGHIFYQASETRIASAIASVRRLGLSEYTARPTILAELDSLMHAMHSYLTANYSQMEFQLNRAHLLTKFQCDLGFDCTPPETRPKNIGPHYAAWSHN